MLQNPNKFDINVINIKYNPGIKTVSLTIIFYNNNDLAIGRCNFFMITTN